MKKLHLVLLLVTCVVFSTNAQRNRFCEFGITFEISNNPSWAYGEPVVLTVDPFSQADKAGIKVGDVIMEVNGAATYLRNYPTIAGWLFESGTPEIKLTVRNVNTYFKEFTIERQCKNFKAVSEFSLASMFSFYSIENTSDRAFSLPIKVDPNINVDLSDYYTFDFLHEGAEVPAIDNYINTQLERALISRGLTRDTKNPDIIVQSYYSYQPNLKFDASINTKSLKTWRYNSETKEMIQLPLLSAGDPQAEFKGQYILELGVRFFDKKYIDPNKLTQIWDCKSREFLTEQYDLQEYARIHAPLMMMQYPYASAKTVAKYIINFKKFSYTGMNFDADDMKTLTDVDADSPAFAAGLRAGDVVKKIGNAKFNQTKEQFDAGYKRFIVESMPLRNPKTRFIDAGGFPDCMLWDKRNYDDVAKMLEKSDIYASNFGYLYSFEKYIPSAGIKGIEVEVTGPNGNKKVRIAPQVQTSVVVRAIP